jgi:hypothetical protein
MTKLKISYVILVNINIIFIHEMHINIGLDVIYNGKI